MFESTLTVDTAKFSTAGYLHRYMCDSGTVLFSIRVSLTLSCPMNLKLYPLDTQTCPMQIASCRFHVNHSR